MFRATFSRRHTKTHADNNKRHSERDCHRSTTTQLWNADMPTSSNYADVSAHCCHGRHAVERWLTLLSDLVLFQKEVFLYQQWIRFKPFDTSVIMSVTFGWTPWICVAKLSWISGCLSFTVFSCVNIFMCIMYSSIYWMNVQFMSYIFVFSFV
jgi:hypothetical protein